MSWLHIKFRVDEIVKNFHTAWNEGIYASKLIKLIDPRVLAVCRTVGGMNGIMGVHLVRCNSKKYRLVSYTWVGFALEVCSWTEEVNRLSAVGTVRLNSISIIKCVTNTISSAPLGHIIILPFHWNGFEGSKNKNYAWSSFCIYFSIIIISIFAARHTVTLCRRDICDTRSNLELWRWHAHYVCIVRRYERWHNDISMVCNWRCDDSTWFGWRRWRQYISRDTIRTISNAGHK